MSLRISPEKMAIWEEIFEEEYQEAKKQIKIKIHKDEVDVAYKTKKDLHWLMRDSISFENAEIEGIYIPIELKDKIRLVEVNKKDKFDDINWL